MMDHEDLVAVGLQMVAAGVPSGFVLRSIELARENPGMRSLLRLWIAADGGERAEVEADIQELIDDHEPALPAVGLRSAEEVDAIVRERKKLKEHVRTMVEARGGVTRVARRAGMPQSSLSRLLNDLSEPRPATLNRLANAMSVRPAELHPPSRRDGRQLAEVLQIGPYLPRHLYNEHALEIAEHRSRCSR